MKRALAMALLLSLSIGTTAYANNGQGMGYGREDTVNINDYSTDNWDRFSFNYQFASGMETKDDFGKPTPTDEPARSPQLENVRRNKDAAYLPPAYGVFSGNIPTERSSLYHDNETSTYASNVTNTSIDYNSIPDSTSSMGGTGSAGGTLPSTSLIQGSNSSERNTEARYYDDGSIGTIKIPELDLKVTVYEGETNEYYPPWEPPVSRFRATRKWYFPPSEPPQHIVAAHIFDFTINFLIVILGELLMQYHQIIYREVFLCLRRQKSEVFWNFWEKI